MAVKIGNACIDENGKVSGGTAGDQTGREVKTQSWYACPWDTVLRAKDETVREALARSMEYACANEHIGYNQSRREGLYLKIRKLGFAPESMKKLSEDTETDCSALVAVCLSCAGIEVSPSLWTGNLADAVMRTGKFERFTDSGHTAVSANLKRGDILLNTVKHTAIVLSDGSGAEKEMFDTAKTWTNGSTDEPVYADTAKKTKIGSLNPYESCSCPGIVDGMYMVLYAVDGTDCHKVGFVEYSGGVK